MGHDIPCITGFEKLGACWRYRKTWKNIPPYSSFAKEWGTEWNVFVKSIVKEKKDFCFEGAALLLHWWLPSSWKELIMLRGEEYYTFSSFLACILFLIFVKVFFLQLFKSNNKILLWMSVQSGYVTCASTSHTTHMRMHLHAHRGKSCGHKYFFFYRRISFIRLRPEGYQWDKSRWSESRKTREHSLTHSYGIFHAEKGENYGFFLLGDSSSDKRRVRRDLEFAKKRYQWTHEPAS